MSSSTRNKSLFASFSSEKEVLFLFLKEKNQKTFIRSPTPAACYHPRGVPFVDSTALPAPEASRVTQRSS
jgi:hypothetical protein